MMSQRVSATLRVAMAAGMLLLTSCENGNLFGRLHKEGQSGDSASLSLDAENALREKRYSDALALYERLLANNPNDAKALYGAAAAAIGTSGLNFGILLSNLLHNNSAPSVNDIFDYVAQSRETIHANISVDANSLLNGVNLDALNNVIDLAICRLQRIVAGATDGTIQPNDIDVILNFGSLCLTRAALRPLRRDLIDIRNVNGQFEIFYPPAGVATFNCGGATEQEVIQEMVADVAGAYALFNRAVALLNLSGNQVIVQLRNDISEVAGILLSNTNPDQLPADCRALLNGAGINETTVLQQTGAFSSLSGC